MALGLFLAGCKEAPVIIDGPYKVNYTLTNNLDSPVSVKAWLSSPFDNTETTIGLKPGEEYGYWQDALWGDLEKDKTPVFNADSLDIAFESGKHLKLYSAHEYVILFNLLDGRNSYSIGKNDVYCYGAWMVQDGDEICFEISDDLLYLAE